MAVRVKHRQRGPVDYTRHRQPVAPRPRLVLDLDLLATLRTPQAERDGNRLSPKGACYDCGCPVSGERRFCGLCLAKHGR